MSSFEGGELTVGLAPALPSHPVSITFSSHLMKSSDLKKLTSAINLSLNRADWIVEILLENCTTGPLYGGG